MSAQIEPGCSGSYLRFDNVFQLCCVVLENSVKYAIRLRNQVIVTPFNGYAEPTSEVVFEHNQ
eukprot:5998877-Amphidinium_carterae.1